ncbi:hypothetical protein [Staphylococcus epidermidis]|uniref:hypothetical protein n=1 Tax=Staphylococcus epidermidis TaxID=1282 RepID=UPI00128B150D|nr:hypothetical protein [Staphylococcus epidermidis]MEA1862842.1 hypothetical protein [Staphylococcus epidermidis]NAM81314.1 hypothetical protein [Staphylococcus epidermidis]
MKKMKLLSKFIDFLYRKFPKLSNLILNHIILLMFSILLPIAVAGVYSLIVKHLDQNHLLIEILTFIIWFTIATIIDYLFISVLAKDNIKTKEGADKYKYWLSIIYFFTLTLVSFLTISKLIENNTSSIIAFLITISLGSLSPTATYVFRNHTNTKDSNKHSSINKYQR